MKGLILHCDVTLNGHIFNIVTLAVTHCGIVSDLNNFQFA